MEPETTLNYSAQQSEVGASFNWDGKLTGAGEMELTNITDNYLAMDLQFQRPFKSSAKVAFHLEEKSKSTTRASWKMNSQLPFFLFWMVKKMKVYIGVDYERGLKMLKDYLETGSVPSAIEIDASSKIQPQHYIGLEGKCDLHELATVMGNDFTYLFNYIEEHNIPLTSAPFSIVKSYDVIGQSSSFITAIPVNETMKVIPPLISGFIKEQNGLKVTHTGFYEHLGNAWSTAMAYSRSHKIKTTKEPLRYEFYLNDPAETPRANLLTEVILPIK